VSSNGIFRDKRDQKLSLAAVVGLLLTLFYLHIVNRNGIDDDAYIHFRLVENFIEHGELNFNIGEPVYAGTSLIWLLVLRLCALFEPDPVRYTSVLNACVTTMFVVVFSVLLRRKHQLSFFSCFIVSAFATLPILYSTSLGLMETPLAMLAIFCAMALLETHFAWALVIAGLSAFIRPELGVFFGLFLLGELTKAFEKRDLRAFLGNTAGAFLALGGLLLFCLYNWGTIIPQPMIAKPIVYEVSSYESINMLKALAFNFELDDVGLTMMVLKLWLGIIFVSIFLTIRSIALEMSSKENGSINTSLALLSGGVWISCAYCYSKTLLHFWYGPTFLLPIIGAILLRKNAFVGTVQLTVTILIVIHQAALSFFPSAVSIYSGELRPKFVQDYINIGKELRSQFPSAKVLSPEIGALGWGFKGYIYDAVGLATPAALQFHPLRIPEERRSHWHGSIPPKMVEAFLPDVIVTPVGLAQAFLASPVINQYTQSTAPSFYSKHILTFFRSDYVNRAH
jgi:hypothetical protein